MKNRTVYNNIWITTLLILFLLPITAISEVTINLIPMQTVGEAPSGDSEGADQSNKRITIKPIITIGSKWDSNFYKTETNEKSGWTHLFQPGILIGYNTGKSEVSFKYTLNATHYSGIQDDDYIGHTMLFSGITRPFTRVSLGLDDSYFWTRDSGQADQFRDSTVTEEYAINRLSPYFFYQFGEKFAVRLRYQHTLTDYSENSEDSSEHRGIANLLYHFNPTTAFDFEYQRWIRDYDRNSSDYVSNQLKIILRKQFRRFSLEAGAGYHNRSFDVGTLNDIDLFTYRFAISSENFGRNHIQFAYERNLNDSGSNNSYFIANQFTLSAGRIFLEKISANIEAKYRISDYESGSYGGREDDLYGISTGIRYKFKEWLTLNSTIGYEIRDSNFTGYDYDNAYFRLSLDSGYDLGTGEATQEVEE